MKNRSKALLLVLCALMLVVTTVFTTLAYLTDNATITNTFTIGNVAIKLTETKTNEYGVAVNPEVILDADTSSEGNTYKLVPGASYTKDPTITVQEKSEPSYVFVKVENGLADIEAAGNTTINSQILANDWTAVAEGVYAYETIVDARTTAQELPVFENVKLATDANVSEYGNAKITITAYAIQANGFEGETAVADAWAALVAEFPAQG